MQPIESAALKAAASAVGVIVLAVRIKRSNKPLHWFGLNRPPVIATAAFVILYLAWMLATDLLTHWRGPWDFKPWQEAPLLASILRVLAVCVLGPLVEELLFRGVIFAWLRDRIHVGLAIAATAFSWSVLHYQYDWWIIAIIFVDGLMLGVARWRTKSVVAPALMHMFYNLYAIW